MIYIWNIHYNGRLLIERIRIILEKRKTIRLLVMDLDGSTICTESIKFMRSINGADMFFPIRIHCFYIELHFISINIYRYFDSIAKWKSLAGSKHWQI